MRSSEISYIGVSATAMDWQSLDHHVPSFHVSFSVFKTGTGDITADVQRTLSNLDPADTAVSARASTLMTISDTTAAAISNPAAALRLNFTAVSGSANVTFQILQAGN